MDANDSVRDILRGMPAFPERMPAFDPQDVPDSPVELFRQWLKQAVDDGVSAPHAVNVATVGGNGLPDARIVILKDLSRSGWSFATASSSPKGQQLEANPRAALTFFWAEVGRQVRVQGQVTQAGAEENAADFTRRHPVARALVIAGRQSGVLGSRGELDEAVADQAARIEAAETPPVSATWTVYTVSPEVVEFWQADPERRHTRLRYSRHGDGWNRDLLWP